MKTSRSLRPRLVTGLAAVAAVLAACVPLTPSGTMGLQTGSRPAPDVQPIEQPCATLIAALLRAREQPRVAQYRAVAGKPLDGLAPVATREGDLVQEIEFGVWVTQRLPAGRDPLVDALRAARVAGTARCNSEGIEPHGGLSVLRLSFDHPDVDARHNPTTLLIDRASGLPVFHTYASMPDAGYAWRYGGPRSGADVTPVELAAVQPARAVP